MTCILKENLLWRKQVMTSSLTWSDLIKVSSATSTEMQIDIRFSHASSRRRYPIKTPELQVHAIALQAQRYAGLDDRMTVGWIAY